MENKKIEEVIAIQDDSCHWYVLPKHLRSEFISDLVKTDFIDSGGFDAKYGKYMTGGDLNLVQLFAYER